LLIRLGHRPDSDDAFRFWGLTAGEVDPRGFEFEHVLQDIQTLNEWAFEGRLEATAISLHTYPFVQERYAILPHGASMSSGAGPVVVSREPLTLEALARTEIAVPGRMTTAFLVLQLFLGGEFRFREVPPDRVVVEVQSGRAGAGLLIGEDQLTYESNGLRLVVDLGEWWLLETGLPLPLGVNVARRDLGATVLRELSEVLGASIAAALDNRSRALAFAVEHGQGNDAALTDRFVRIYVSEPTEDYGDEGREAVQELLARGERAGAFERVRIDFVA
jgi:1,4-dihydroxy-6-naphthoate synthase